MLKYRVYDTRANKYLDRKSVAIEGNGVLQIDKRALRAIEMSYMIIQQPYFEVKD